MDILDSDSMLIILLFLLMVCICICAVCICNSIRSAQINELRRIKAEHTRKVILNNLNDLPA